ncbi:ubiquitin-like-conjugating enzyme ATG10 [Homarus americanus]|uniref:ubiquitin-like-conjugating enzyme ATG10 n=1 Tax=Homarus americanus TaxID=6706 RepID=UPI001C478122|nr:ubiquitin-like-conjugating enzyme ATG10 [Homarus americanus]XP_042243184.1 ubiquitin-like-conjugating enzyme ATG10 [Homarus americanus]XP_042243185.1 ubiquitin-like-conjugating enzyme ATG10 [Homarus americanus]XP_042243186.1 ubiquitin-like-conjugating enzyme ATG10 [Homarus americanus]
MACITYEDFTVACLEFVKMSEKLGDNWKIRGNVQEEGALYLTKTVFIENGFGDKEETLNRLPFITEKCNTVIAEDQVEESTSLCDEQLEMTDPSAVEILKPKFFFTYEYHILYSLSHSVPTLYFNAWHSSGKLLTLEEIWKSVNSQFKEQINQNKWESLTQKEHPLLGQPFFQLHPCYTGKLMDQVKLVSHDSRFLYKYLVSWLSMFGPVIGLELFLNYFLD